MLTQRLGSSTQLNDGFISEFIRIVKEHPGSCDEVWLATSYGFPPLSVHANMAKKLAVTAEKMKNIGLRVSLQISNTIGHGQYMSSLDCSGLVYDGSPVEKMVGDDGTVADYCFCWRGENFRKYVKEEIGYYAREIKPYTVWIDDDLRAVNHNPVSRGCFCKNCIKTFNDRYNSDFTRETLVKEINHGDVLWRERFVDFIVEGLADFAFEVYSVIHKESPETRGGLQNGTNGRYTGVGYPLIFKAMLDATGKNPGYRAGGGAYHDHNPNSQLDKADCLAWQNSMLPDFVTDIRPEIENLYDVRFGKTIAGTCYETSLYMANGANAMSYAMLMDDYEEMDWHGEMLGMFASHRKYWEKLCHASSISKAGGVYLKVSESSWKRPLSENEGNWVWTNEPYTFPINNLHATAIPYSYEKTKNPIYLTTLEQAKSFSDEEITDLLDKPLFTDGETLHYLVSRGFGDKIGADADYINVGQFHEKFTAHPINDGLKSGLWSQSFYYTAGYAIRDKNGKTEPIGYYATKSLNAKKNYPNEEYVYGVANAIVHTSKGAKWAVFGAYPWNNFISSDKRNQIIHALDYISDNRLPAILETPVQGMLYPRENEDEEVVSVSVLNTTVGESGELTIRVRRPLMAGENALFDCQYGQETKVEVKHDGNDVLVTIPSLKPWTVGTVFFC